MLFCNCNIKNLSSHIFCLEPHVVQDKSSDCRCRQTVRPAAGQQSKWKLDILVFRRPWASEGAATAHLRRHGGRRKGIWGEEEMRIHTFDFSAKQALVNVPARWHSCINVNILYGRRHLWTWVEAEVVWTRCFGPTCQRSSWGRWSSTPSEREEQY